MDYAHCWALFLRRILLSHGEAYLGLLDYHLPSAAETARNRIWPGLDFNRCCDYI